MLYLKTHDSFILEHTFIQRIAIILATAGFIGNCLPVQASTLTRKQKKACQELAVQAGWAASRGETPRDLARASGLAMAALGTGMVVTGSIIEITSDAPFMRVIGRILPGRIIGGAMVTTAGGIAIRTGSFQNRVTNEVRIAMTYCDKAGAYVKN